jgi:hypothetical protein
VSAAATARHTVSTDLAAAAAGAAALAATATGQELATLAYLAVYAGGYDGTGDVEPFRALRSCPRDERFLAALWEAVPDTRVVEIQGVAPVGGGGSLVEVDGIRCHIPAEVLDDGQWSGDGPVRLRIPVLLGSVMPGFVVRSGAIPLADRRELTRLYLDLEPEGAAWMLGSLARQLDAAGLAHEMKALANPRAYLRHDAGVVYVPTASLSGALEVVVAALDEAPPAVVGPGAPVLTERIARGLSLADEPSDLGPDLSHGQWVASMLTDAVQACEARGVTADAAAVEAAIRHQIAAAGRDVDRPFRRGSGPAPGAASSDHR